MALFFDQQDNLIRDNYKKITEDFCRLYYNLYSTNFQGINNLCCSDILITYLGEEIKGFNKYFSRIRQYGIYKFNFSKINISSQPMGTKNLLISVNGSISVNDHILNYKFVESIILYKEIENKFLISNIIFKLIE